MTLADLAKAPAGSTLISTAAFVGVGGTGVTTTWADLTVSSFFVVSPGVGKLGMAGNSAGNGNGVN